MPDFQMPLAGRHVHFNGLGGKGIAPAASLAHQAGMHVTGDDLAPNHRTRALAAESIAVTLGSNTVPAAELLVAKADTVWVLPVADAAVPGGEAPDAHVRLTELIRLEGTPAYTIRPGGELPLPPNRTTGPVLVATAGYDASLETFSALHDQTIRAFGAEPTPAA